MTKSTKAGLILIFMSSVVLAKGIFYTLSMSAPQTHLFEVEMRLEGSGSKEVVAMPVWTPGSYLIREYAKNVQDVEAFSEKGTSLVISKLDKNHWEIQGQRGQDIIVRYRVYAYEYSVRTSYLNTDHALVVPASVLMYWDKNQKRVHQLHIDLPEAWSQITTSLRPFNQPGNVDFTAADYDELADSPLELGNQHVIEFEVLGKPHLLAIYGASNYVDSVLVADISRIIKAEAAIFGGLAYDHYAFIIHAEDGRGGLEHAGSSVNFVPRWSFTQKKRYHSFLSLISHEFLHLWNVKRLAPKGISQFDYDQENYLEELWVAEGFTSYYDELILQRVGLSSRDEYLEIVKDEINILEARPGKRHQSVTESSFDTWIKYYRPNEHSENATISYYNKGNLLGLLLDIKIIAATQGKASLDDVMLKMYRDFALKQKGYTSQDIQRTCEAVSGLDLDDFFEDFVHGVAPLPYAEVFSMAGLALDSSSEKSAWLGWRLREEAGNIKISRILENSPAWDVDLNEGDELIAIDGFRVSSVPISYLGEKIPGDRLVCTVSRNGVLKDVQVTVGFTPVAIQALEQRKDASESQQQVFEKWLAAAPE